MNGHNKEKQLGPRELAEIEKIQASFQTTFESFGFQKISLPMVEASDLYLKKLGDRIKSQMYVFNDHDGKEICLRPEMTSSTIKYFMDHHQHKILPFKFCYIGEVFRSSYNEDQTREFTHIGTEIIGVESILEDAENIALACSCLENLGIDDYKINLGNVGIITELVNNLDVDVAFKNFFLENLRTEEEGHSFLQQAIKQGFLPSEPDSNYQELLPILKKLNSDEEKKLIHNLLNVVYPAFPDDIKEAEEIVDGLLAKIKRENQYEDIQQILKISEDLKSFRGQPESVFANVKNYLAKLNIGLPYVEDLEKVCQFLSNYGIDQDKISIDLGLTRNLQYYTGIIFEMDYAGFDKENPICGGGRYDDLIETLGYQQPLSGCGFAFELEKISNILLKKKQNSYLFRNEIIDLYFIIQNGDRNQESFSIIRQIRHEGVNVYTDISNKNLHERLTELKKQGFTRVAVCGEDDADANHVKLIDLKQDVEEVMSLAELFGKLCSL